MGFTIYCILEAALLIANAIAILNDRFLKTSKFYLLTFAVGFHVNQIERGSPEQQNQVAPAIDFGGKNSIILLLHTFKNWMKCKNNIFLTKYRATDSI